MVLVAYIWATDRWTNGPTDGGMEGRTEGRTDRPTDGRTDGWTDRQSYSILMESRARLVSIFDMKMKHTTINYRRYAFIGQPLGVVWLHEVKRSAIAFYYTLMVENNERL